jgi:hypothetical protein
VDNSFENAVKLAKQGNKEEAYQILLYLTRHQPRNPKLWLWMSEVVDDWKAKRWCLENVLAYDPGNRLAHLGLAHLSKREKAVADQEFPIISTTTPSSAHS